ncbi:MAG: metal ABC transporter substrate-binding protein [Aquihabitans sp.]
MLTGALMAGSVVGCSSAPDRGDGLHIEAAFYPLAYVAEEVGGNLVTVHELTPAGAEPHDLDLKPRDVGRMSDADLVVYLAGLQPAVDDAVRDADATAFEVSDAAVLDLMLPEGTEHEHGDDHADESESAGDDAHDEDGTGAPDPHFWLDPTKLASVATAVGERLADIDPPNAATYRANAASLVTELTDLDTDLATGLADCAETDLVTSHLAFGYLARRYGFHQVGISGLSPNREPSAAKLAEVADFIRDNGVSTVYFETLASPALAEALAGESGAATAVLDPIEGISDDSPGTDYPSVMRANLSALRSGQRCP